MTDTLTFSVNTPKAILQQGAKTYGAHIYVPLLGRMFGSLTFPILGGLVALVGLTLGALFPGLGSAPALALVMLGVLLILWSIVTTPGRQLIARRLAAVAGAGAAWQFVLSDTYIEESNEAATYRFHLGLVTHVLKIRDGSAIGAHGMTMVIADKDLPEGLTPTSFRAEVARRVRAAGGEIMRQT